MTQAGKLRTDPGTSHAFTGPSGVNHAPKKSQLSCGGSAQASHKGGWKSFGDVSGVDYTEPLLPGLVSCASGGWVVADPTAVQINPTAAPLNC